MKKRDEQLAPIPIPALIAILLKSEHEKGSPLTEDEVLRIRDNAACIMLSLSAKNELEESRGYPDISQEYVWEQWQEARLELNENS